jgi:ankyrin repeat protein
MSSLKDFANAIECDDSPTVRLLVSRRLVDVNARLPLFRAPPALVFAAQRDQRKIVDILLRGNARVDDVDKNGQTACHVAATRGHHVVLALLLARHPNLAVVDANGKTALYCALSYSTRDDGRCALMLLAAGASLYGVDPSDLCWFAAKSTAAIQALLDRGVAVRELRDTSGRTPLHEASGPRNSIRDPPAVFEMLVNVCGIDLEARSYAGITCLHVAASDANFFALRWLLNGGADANSLTSNGSTPLHYAIHCNGAVILLAAGADVCARDKGGRTALHLHRVPPQRSRMSVEMTAVFPLLAAGADLDAADDDGNTCRHLLAARGWTIDPDQIEAARRDIARRESTLCVIEHFKFVSGCNCSNSMRCKCAKS